MTIKAALSASTLLFVGCLPLKNDSLAPSSFKGYDSQQLGEFEQARGVALEPNYSRLSSLDSKGEGRRITMSIFISYDHLDADQAAIVHSGATGKGTAGEYDPWSTHPNKDYGAAAYAEILAWLVDGKDSVLKSAEIDQTRILNTPTAYSRIVRGRGPSLPQANENMDWEILLYLGVAGTPDFAKAFGEAMAVSHISMLNGHFYTEDAAAAQKSSAEKGQANRRFRDWSDADAQFDPFWSRQKSQIYGPAMAAFVAKANSIAPEKRLAYRVAVFNGCGSEKIEDLVLDAMPKVKAINESNLPAASEVELVGMRGFSNYRHFPSQIHRFVRALIQQAKWRDILSTFEFDDASTSQAMREYLGRSKVGNSSPVYRSAVVGADGEAKSQQRQRPRNPFNGN